MPAQGLSHSELVRTSVMYSPGLHHLTPPHSTGPSPSGWSWIQPASPLDGGDPGPFVLIPFKSTSPRSDSWHRIGRNFAFAYIRTYRWPASGWALRSRFLALSSASVALFQPYLAFGRYQVSLSH